MCTIISSNQALQQFQFDKGDVFNCQVFLFSVLTVKYSLKHIDQFWLKIQTREIVKTFGG